MNAYNPPSKKRVTRAAPADLCARPMIRILLSVTWSLERMHNLYNTQNAIENWLYQLRHQSNIITSLTIYIYITHTTNIYVLIHMGVAWHWLCRYTLALQLRGDCEMSSSSSSLSMNVQQLQPKANSSGIDFTVSVFVVVV